MKSDPGIIMIGNGHIDPIWMWRWEEGFTEVKATFRSALDRMNEYDDYVFTCSSAAVYKWVEENEPSMFDEIKERVKEGRWSFTGGWWVQCDCNLPSGESFARQALLGQNYFKSRFGKICNTAFNQDAFGHNISLPRIIKRSGIDNYVFRRPEAHQYKINDSLFWWEGQDKSRLLCYRIPHDYSTYWLKKRSIEKSEEWKKINSCIEEKDSKGHSMMVFYGIGNHGGGPTRAQINRIEEYMKRYPENKVSYGSTEGFFDRARKENIDNIPVISDEIQNVNRGAYSSNSRIKLLNRKAENRMICAEIYSSMAKGLTDHEYDNEKLNGAWEKVLFNQFHDDICGCGTKEAYEEGAYNMMGYALTCADEEINSAAQKISWNIDTHEEKIDYISKDKNWFVWEMENLGTPVVVFNSSPRKVKVPVVVKPEIKSVEDSKGENIPFQYISTPYKNNNGGYNSLFMAEVPAFGYTTMKIFIDKESEKPHVNKLSVKEREMQNEFINFKISEDTGMPSYISLWKKDICIMNNEVSKALVINTEGIDTWGSNADKYDKIIGQFKLTDIQILEQGPVRACIKAVCRYKDSFIEIRYYLHAGSDSIDMKVKVNLNEKQKMIKFMFPIQADEPVIHCNIPYGFIKRPADGKEHFCHKWIDISGNDAYAGKMCGLAVLNDGKYSYSAEKNKLFMTVANSVPYAYYYFEHIPESKDYDYLDQGIQEFDLSLVPYSGKFDPSVNERKAKLLNMPYTTITETYHKGTLPVEFEGIRINAENVETGTLKISEDKKGYILRMYETSGKKTDVIIDFKLAGRKIKSCFTAYDIKTFYIPLDKEKEVFETNLIEGLDIKKE